jgi:RNA polymerase sigma-70 factor (ECF subfamily)
MGVAARPAERTDRAQALRERLVEAVDRVCPTWLRAQRDDIVQVAMLKVLAIAEREGEGDSRLTPSYLYRVAYTATIDEIRRLRSRDEVEMQEQQAAPTPDPERETERRQLARAIVDCVGRLVEARREAVTLYLQGHGVPEAARLLGWDAKRVENLVYRGLGDLRKCLSSKGVTP